MNRRLSSAFCTLLLLLLVLVPVASWVLGALDMPIHNVLCAEGYRWVWLHATDCLAPPYIIPVIALFVMLGSVRASGLLNVLRRKRRTVNEKLGLLASSVTFALLFSAFLVPVFKVESAMRSVTGHLFPSPWFSCAPYTLSTIVFITMMTYAVLAKKESFYLLVGQLLSAGVSRYGLWIINLSLLNFLIEIIKYILI